MHAILTWDIPTYRGERGYATLTLDLDGERVFVVREGEIEDRSLYRDFRDCRKLLDLLRLAYQAGVDQAGLVIEFRTTDTSTGEVATTRKEIF